MDILQAAKLLRPDASWNLRAGMLEQAEDGTPRVSLPTTEELQPLLLSDKYAEQRRNEYPALADQLDAIWKGGDSLDAMRKQVMAIKAKYPKGDK